MRRPVVLRRCALWGAAAVVAALGLLLHLRVGGPFIVEAIDDIAEAAAAFVGAVPCLLRARRSSGRWRASWFLLAAALISWGVGQSIWSYYEVIASRVTPFPSLADVGFLLFPAFGLPGLLIRPSSAFRGRGRVRILLDGAMVASSLFVISWMTALGSVFVAGAQSMVAMLVSLAYPLADVVLLSVAIMIGIRARSRIGLVLLVAGMGAMAFSDSAFTYMTAAGMDTTGSVSDLGWIAAFLLIGLAAFYPPTEERTDEMPLGSPVSVSLPYALVLVSVSALVVSVLRGSETTVGLLVAVIAVLALVLRQLLTLLDNRRLTRDVLATQAELQFAAYHDALTGLANRAMFCDRLAHALALRERDARAVSVVFCDLDDFKSVNDTLGHGAGDGLLTTVGERLRALGRRGDTIARLGGDEFAILIEDDCDLDVFARRLLDALREPVVLSGTHVQVRASIGTASARADEGEVTSQELLVRADVAMYAAKHEGRDQIVHYVEGLGRQRVAELDERAALTGDIAAGRLQTALQPIVDQAGEVIAHEALARWTYRGTAVPPPRFVHMADEAGVLGELDLLVARNAMRFVAARCTDAHSTVSINLGLSHLHDPRLAARLLQLLEEFGVDPGLVMIEVPETDAVADSNTWGTLTRLRDLGFGIAIDDFGVGYSNLARLVELEPDVVKLDRSLVGPLPYSPTASRVVEAAIGLAHDLGARVVAEGVETDEQWSALRAAGCDALQGYLFGRPMVPEEVGDERLPAA